MNYDVSAYMDKSYELYNDKRSLSFLHYNNFDIDHTQYYVILAAEYTFP